MAVQTEHAILFITWKTYSMTIHVTIGGDHLKYLYSSTISLTEPILDRRGSYIHELHSLTRRYSLATSRIIEVVDWPT